MSFARPVSTNGLSLSARPTLPLRLPSKQLYNPKMVSKSPLKKQEILLSSIPSQNELEEIVGNLSTIVKRSEALLTPVRQPHFTTSVRRTSSLHLTKVELDRRKLSHTMNKPSSSSIASSDRASECSMSSSTVPRRTSIRPPHHADIYSGIKCALPSFKPTIPNAFNGLEKHRTPTKNHQSKTSSTDNQMTVANSNRDDKSPWRLRFEKFLSHEEPTPLASSMKPVPCINTKTSLLDKENRTRNVRLPTRRMSTFNLPS